MNLIDIRGTLQQAIDTHIVMQRRLEPLNNCYIRASSIADDPRNIVFSLMNLPRDLYPRFYGTIEDSAVGYKLMAKGTGIHRFVQKWLQEMALLKKKDTEKNIKDAKYLFSGHCDGVITSDDAQALLEIKTINARGFSILTQPKEEHIYQGHAYAYFVNKVFGYSCKEILFLYINREDDTTQMKEFWEPVRADTVNMILDKLTTLKQYIKERKIPAAHPNYDPSQAPWKWSEYNTLRLYGSGITDMCEYEGVNILANC